MFRTGTGSILWRSKGEDEQPGERKRMSAPEPLMLLGLSALFAKHFIVDFVLQNGYQLQNKGRYGHPGGLLHSGLHALFTAPVLLLLTRDAGLIGLICGGEFLLHYHMDWAKDRLVQRFRLTIKDAAYWHAFGFDQFVHALTYIGIVALLGVTS